MYDSSTGGLHLEHGHNYSSSLQISILMDMLCNRNETTPCLVHGYDGTDPHTMQG